MKQRTSTAVCAVAVIVLLIVAINHKTPAHRQFQPLGRDSLLGTLSFLAVVALFVERAVEVIVSTLRDAGAVPLETAADAAQTRVDAEAKLVPPVATSLPALHEAQARLADYRVGTKQVALCASFLLGIFVSLAGVRAFSSIMTPTPWPSWVFTAADVVVTGAIVAGGSDAIHQMMNVVTNLLGNAAEKAKGT